MYVWMRLEIEADATFLIELWHSLNPGIAQTFISLPEFHKETRDMATIEKCLSQSINSDFASSPEQLTLLGGQLSQKWGAVWNQKNWTSLSFSS